MADPEDTDGTPAGAELPADPSFEVEDARLNEALHRADRERAGAPGAAFGHDETYRPGYHEGGVRFGFFNDDDKTPPQDKPDGTA